MNGEFVIDATDTNQLTANEHTALIYCNDIIRLFGTFDNLLNAANVAREKQQTLVDEGLITQIPAVTLTDIFHIHGVKIAPRCIPTSHSDYM